MKYVFTIELETDEIIGSKEQLAMILENIGSVKVVEIKEQKKD